MENQDPLIVILDDALTMGLYVSEVEDEFKACYAQFARDNGQSYLVDIPVGAS